MSTLMNPAVVKDLARRGAQARLMELDTERSQLMAFLGDKAFIPENGEVHQISHNLTKHVTHKRHLSPAHRKAVSLRMKKYWAERRRLTAVK